MSARFVHLRVHTEYSLRDSVVRVKPLMHQVAAAGMPAVALTDECNLFAMVKFYRQAHAAGVKPLIGVDTWVAEARGHEPFRITLLCQNESGFKNLTKLVTRSHLDGRSHGRAVMTHAALKDNSDGLIALSGALSGDIGRALSAGRASDARNCLNRWLELFGDRFYIELQRLGRANEEQYVHRAVDLAARSQTPVVATNNVRFVWPDDFEPHEARVCIHDGHVLSDPGRPKHYSPQQYLRSPAEMTECFSDLPEALENTVEVALRCNLTLELDKARLPEYPLPEGENAEAYLRTQSVQGLADRLKRTTTLFGRDVYEARLERELEVINRMGFAGYFLIVADFIRWTKEQDIPVGPGRGSGAGSLVAYVLGITNLNPLRYDLLFERFLNPERVSMPDFDIDFCMEGRDRVIEYVAERYGRDRVSQIITYGTMAARAVVRDVGRVLGHPYGFVDRIAKLIPFEIGMTLDRALDEDAELKRQYKDEEEVRALIDLARPLEGLARNAGRHAGGVVIAPGPLTDFCPLYCEPDSTATVTQFDKDDIEAIGLVKFDFLGLRTLTIIHRAVETINVSCRGNGESSLDVDLIPMDDSATFALLKRCATTAVFQLESRGMKELIKRLQPDAFEDIIALVALFRPGPLQSGMVDDFISRKHDRTAVVDYLHTDLEPILKPTYGVILYQEQVMQIAQVLAGYTLGSADLLRRAMGKKKPEEMAKQRLIFIEGAVARGVEEGTAAYIFDLIEKFAGYGFNKSHSAAYALLAYQTAYLKAHYPAAFMASVLSADMDNTDKIVVLIDECGEMGLEMLPPDVNVSRYAFEMSGETAIRYGLGAVKGVGHGAVESLVAERETNGPFEDLDDLCRRLDLSKINRRVLESLIRCGALDGFGANRNQLMAHLPTAVQASEQQLRASDAGQEDLFGLGSGDREKPVTAVPELPDWSDSVRLAGEKETLGLYLTGHPVNQYQRELDALTSGRISSYVADDAPTNGDRNSSRREVIIGGLVVNMRRRGNRVTLLLDDRTGRIEVTLFDETYRKYRDIIANDSILLIDGQLSYDDFINGWRVTARRLWDIDAARERHAGRLVVSWSVATDAGEFVHRLRETLDPYRQGDCDVVVTYVGSAAKACFSLGDEWTVRPSRELLSRLNALVGQDGVRVDYPNHIELSGDL